MSSGGTRSTRVAAKLVARASDAIAQGEEEIARQLIAKAASMYELAGQPEEASALRAGGLTREAEGPAVLPGAPAAPPLARREPVGPPLLEPLEDEDPDSAPMVPSLLPGTPLTDDLEPPAPGSSGFAPAFPRVDHPADAVRAEVALVEVEVGEVSHLGSPEAVDTLGWVWADRLGRSPCRGDLEDLLLEMGAARAMGALDYANHLEAMIRLLEPGHPDGQPERPGVFPDPLAGTKRAEPAGGEVHASGFRTWADSAAEPMPPVVDSFPTSAAIDAAITALVGGDEAPSSAPLDVDGLAFSSSDLGPLPALASTGPEDRGASSGSEPAEKDRSGSVLRGRFRLERRVGRGAQAEVYLARDQVLDRPLAIKVLSPHLADDPDALEGFLAEARLAARVQHPGCLAVFDFGREGELTFLAMEFFKGRTLRTLLRGGRLEPFLAVHLAKALAEALTSVHAAGIVHRDIKPSNVLVDRDARAKLMDFGVAARIDAHFEPGMMVGTLRYMAPEQARGRKPDPRSDLFSLAAVLWEMLVGTPAFDATLEGLKARMGAVAPPLPANVTVPEVLRELLSRTLSPKPEARPSSAARMAEGLARALAEIRGGRRAARAARSAPAALRERTPSRVGSDALTEEVCPKVPYPGARTLREEDSPRKEGPSPAHGQEARVLVGEASAQGAAGGSENEDREGAAS